MKALIISAFLAAFAGIIVCSARELIERIERVCMFETNVTEAELKKFFNNGQRANEANQNMRCLMKCLMEQRGVFYKNVYNTTNAIKDIMSIPEMKGREDEIKESVNSCKTEKGVNDCDTAFKISMCLLEFLSRKQ